MLVLPDKSYSSAGGLPVLSDESRAVRRLLLLHRHRPSDTDDVSELAGEAAPFGAPEVRHEGFLCLGPVGRGSGDTANAARRERSLFRATPAGTQRDEPLTTHWLECAVQ